MIYNAVARFNLLQEDYIFPEDGARLHYSHGDKTYLNNKGPGNWTWRGGPVVWQVCSPNLILEISICELLSSQVCLPQAEGA